MRSVLHLDSGANRSSESVTRTLTARFAQAWRHRHGAGGYRYRDLVRDPVPPIDTPFCALGRRVERHGIGPVEDVTTLAVDRAERDAWAATEPLIAEVVESGILLIGAPMYNYGIPAALKAWIDRVTFPGAFTDRRTGQSLLRGLRVVVVTARGGQYDAAGRARNFLAHYLCAYFGRHGVDERNLHVVGAESTLAGLAPHTDGLVPTARKSMARACAEVDALIERL